MPDVVTTEIRAARPADIDFLFALFQSVHEREFGLLPEAQRVFLTGMQFDAQTQGYAAQYPNAQDWIVVADNEPVGRVLWEERAGEVRLIDIAVLARSQGHGLGAMALQRLIGLAREKKKPVGLAVLRSNTRAIGLYARLGFEAVAGSGDLLYLEMRREAC